MATASLWLLISPSRHAKEHRERNKLPLVLIIQRQQYLKYALQNLCYACHSRRPLPLRSLCSNVKTRGDPNRDPRRAWRTKQKNNKNIAAESVQWLSLGASWQAAALLWRLWRPAMRLCLNLDGHVGDSFWLASSFRVVASGAQFKASD